MALSKDELKHLCWLARIELSEDELQTYSRQIEQVIQYLDVLDSIPLHNQEQISVKKTVAELRSDAVEGFPEDPLGTTYRKDGYVKGPRMVP